MAASDRELWSLWVMATIAGAVIAAGAYLFLLINALPFTNNGSPHTSTAAIRLLLLPGLRAPSPPGLSLAVTLVRLSAAVLSANAIGVCQALVLRRHLREEAAWVASTVAGSALALAVLLGGSGAAGQSGAFAGTVLRGGISALIASVALTAAIQAGVVGLCQWALVLRRHGDRLGIWALASALGGALGGVVTLGAALLVPRALPILTLEVLLAAASALVLGGVTGAVLPRLLDLGP